MTGSSAVPGGLVAVHAHPDDETLTSGALLATWAAAHPGATTVVTATRGERGEVIGAELAHLEGDGPALAAHREDELTRALAALGVGGHLYLDPVAPALPGATGGGSRYLDSGMAWAGPGRAVAAPGSGPDAFTAVPVDEAAGRLARVLRDRRPAVVATYEPGGGYGHPDHVRVHDVTMRAVALAADAGWAPHVGPAHRTPVVLWAVAGAERLRAAYRELAFDARFLGPGLTLPDLTLPDPAGPLPSLAVPDDDVRLTVDVAPVLGQVLGALRAYATQVQAVTELPVPGAGGADEVAGSPPAEAGLAAGRLALGRLALGRLALGRYALSNAVLAPILAREEYLLAPGWSADIAWPTGVRRVA